MSPRSTKDTMAPRPPQAKKQPHHLTLHGDRREDVYAWLRDTHWQDVMADPSALDLEIRAHLEVENKYSAEILAPLRPLEQELYDEMRGRIKEDDSTVPTPDGLFAYYRRYRTGGQHPIFCRSRRHDDTTETILFDGDKASEGHAFFHISTCTHSPNHQWIAYGIDHKGSEFYTLKIRQTETGIDLAESIVNTTGQVVWAEDDRTIFYTALDENHRPNKVFRHRIGSDPQTDVLVYQEQDPGFFVGLNKTESGRFIQIHAHDHETTETYILSAGNPEAALQLVSAREKGIEYDVTDMGDIFLILTNADGAEDFKVVEAPISSPSRANWRDRVPHIPGRLILMQFMFKSYWVRLERVNGLPRIVVTELNDGGTFGDEHEIAFAEDAYSLELMPGYEFDTPHLRFSYSSPTTPQQVFDYHMGQRQRRLRKTQEIPSGHDPDDYVTRRLMVAADDGAEIPVTLLYRRTTALDGTAPVLLYGYGSYGHAMPAGFSTNRLSLVDRGFIYAIAHVRGGKDRGYYWYKDGKRDRKKNTFTDFIAVARGLIELGFTGEKRIIAQGGSAGGMLMGAIANMAPDLFLGIIAEVPFVDVLNTMCDASLPLTPPEWPEWGNPIEDAEAYAYIKSYSPYDNVVAQDYPHIFVTAGLTDPRVTYWEPAKWVAKLRATKTDNHLLLFKINMAAGHGGAAGRFDHLKEVATNYAFTVMISKRVTA